MTLHPLYIVTTGFQKFLRLLHQGARAAAGHSDEVVDLGALDALQLADLASDHELGHDVGGGEEVGESTQPGVVAHLTPVLTQLVARDEKG